MTDFTIIEAQPWHCGQMIRRLRKEHLDALDTIGAHPHRELRAMFDRSSFRRAWMIDGKLAAMGGVAGSSLEASGYVWVAISNLARKYPVQMVKEARHQLRRAMLTKQELVTTVIPTDEAAVRLAVFMGFHVSHEGRGQPAFSRFSRRDLVRYIDECPDFRIPVGTGYAVAMGYHPEAA